jgi:hypothetical protein
VIYAPDITDAAYTDAGTVTGGEGRLRAVFFKNKSKLNRKKDIY